MSHSSGRLPRMLSTALLAAPAAPRSESSTVCADTSTASFALCATSLALLVTPAQDTSRQQPLSHKAISTKPYTPLCSHPLAFP